MPKITIYVPDDLKARMEAVGTDVNWSAAAQEAFELMARRLESQRKGAGKMNEVIERLRKSKERSENADRVAGYESGQRWARFKAEYEELRRLNVAFKESELPAEEDQAWTIALIIRDGEKSSAREFWGNIGEEGVPTDAYALGFAEGADDVFEEVDEHL